MLNRVEKFPRPLFSLSSAARESEIRNQDRENAHECSLKIARRTHSAVHISQSLYSVSREKNLFLYITRSIFSDSSSLRSSLVCEKNIFFIDKRIDMLRYIFYMHCFGDRSLWYIIGYIFRKSFGRSNHYNHYYLITYVLLRVSSLLSLQILSS